MHAGELYMVDFNEKIPSGFPKLPDDYWGVKVSDVGTPASEINIVDKNLNATLDDISIFRNKKEP